MKTDKRTTQSSRLSGFYQLSVERRLDEVVAWSGLDARERAALQEGLRLEQAAHMIENVIATLALPLGIATNFRVNGNDLLIPMAVEEPSVVAAVSFAALLARPAGFAAGSTEPVMIGQIQLLDLPQNDLARAAAQIEAARGELLALADQDHPTILALGGGARDLQLRAFPDTPAGPMLIVHLLFDTRDAMGANVINTAVETLAPRLEALSGGRVLLRILSNLADERRAWATCRIAAAALETGTLSGGQMVQGIVEANAFAVVDPYRAATHNKGIMNGIDAVALATGNDWRALEAGAHAYAARDGRYRGLTDWRRVDVGSDVYLDGRLELPLAVGTVGGATRVHPTVQVALKILQQPDARRLAEIMAAVGLAQNLAALRALAGEGIQKGHMALHARQVAMAAGARGDQVTAIAVQMVREKQVRLARAEALMKEIP